MKLYTVKKGTEGFLIDNQAEENSITDWCTRTSISFTETVFDPISLHNGREEYRTALVALAKDGYAIFADNDNTRYMLAVPFNQVEILC